MSAPHCPECSGELWWDPRLGLLGHHTDDCTLGRAEVEQAADDRAAAGHLSTQAPRRGYDDVRQFGRMHVRPITSAEAVLLVACGADPAAAARAQVGWMFLAGGVRRRVVMGVTVDTPRSNLPRTDPRLVR